MKTALLSKGFELVRELGSSNVSTVYLVVDVLSGRSFALKVMRRLVSKNKVLRERWRRESEILMSMSHPNLIQCFDAFDIDDCPAMLLHYYESGSLKDIIDAAGALPWEIASRYLIQICRVLEYLHRYGIIHRDVKPHNILIDQKNGAVLADLGLVKIEEDPDLTQDNVALGSPAYMSPEQARNPATVDEQTDVFSLAATLHHAVSGAPPFLGNGVGEVLYRVIHEPPAPLPLENLPSTFVSMIQVAMAKETNDRYRRVRDFRVDLSRVLLGQKPMMKTPKRSRQTALAAAFVAVLPLLFFLIFQYRDRYDLNQDQLNKGSAAADSIESQAIAPPKVEEVRLGTGEVISFEDWILPYENKFLQYLNEKKYQLALELISEVRTSEPLLGSNSFNDFRLAWVQNADIEVKAEVEAIIAKAFFVLDTFIDEANLKIKSGSFDPEQFESNIESAWSSLGINIEVLPSFSGLPSPKFRLNLAKERLQKQAYSFEVVEQSKLLEGVIVATRPLLQSGNFEEAFLEFQTLNSKYITQNTKAGFYFDQAKSLFILQKKYQSALASLVGQNVEVTLPNGIVFKGELIRDSGQVFFIDYLGQSLLPISILRVSNDFVGKMIPGVSKKLLAQLSWCRFDIDESRFLLAGLSQDNPQYCNYWLREWGLDIFQSSNMERDVAETDYDVQPLFSSQYFQSILEESYPKSLVKSFNNKFDLTLSNFSLDSRWNVLIPDGLRLVSWRVKLLLPDADSVPQTLSFGPNVKLRKGQGVRSETILVGDSLVIGHGLTPSSSYQEVSGDGSLLYLNGEPLSTLIGPFESFFIDSDGKLIVVESLQLIFEADLFQ